MTEADETYIPRSVVTSSGSRPEILGDYRLMEKLGQGGMGAVYRAEHTRLGKQVAVKLLPEESTADPAAVARFQREMKAVGQLQHPNIIQALDAREEGGFHFLVMELVEGIELDDLRKTIGPIRLSDAADIIVQAANGLQHAHEQGLVHRDIKPSNLLLSAEGIVKVLDLGLALLVNGERAMSDNLTVTGQVMGTLDYMAPEQADDTHGVDIRADIYSLGCTFFALLAGKPPFDGAKYTTPVRKITAHMTRQAPSILKRRRDVPPEAARILNRMLAKKPADRFQSPAEVVEALQPLTAKSNLPKLAKKTALKIAQANKKENPDLTGQDTNPQASAGPSTANRIEEPSTEADAASASPPDITDGKVPGDAVPADPADNGTQTAPADLDAAVNSIIVDPPTYADQRAGHKASRRSSSDRGKVPRSLWISLGLAGFVVLLSVIIIKIKDKNGNVVATIEVPEGGSVEIGEAERSQHSPSDKPRGDDSQSGGKSRPEMTSETESEISNSKSEIPEPPPLEEYLKGRKILTVRQDGTADFKTIQAALDALKPGQVVEVLDKGPYVESLRHESLPADVGLVSRVGSVINALRWTAIDTSSQHAPHSFCHALGGPKIRLSGLVFDAMGREQGLLMKVTSLSVCVERCLFPSISTVKPMSLRTLHLNNGENGTVCVRECGIANDLYVNARPGGSRVRVSRNFFGLSTDYSIGVSVGVFDGTARANDISITGNVFHHRSSRAINVGGGGGPLNLRLAIFDNTLLGSNHFLLFSDVPHFPVEMRNNIVAVSNTLSPDGTAKAPQFRTSQNIYRLKAEEDHPFIPLSPTCRYGIVELLSTDDSERDYARPTKKTAGALPPGPAPPEGDWFTRILDRWREAQSSHHSPSDESPRGNGGKNEMSGTDSTFDQRASSLGTETATLTEPPPLEEYLKGRKILTVRQDGTADFTTIQAALDALKPGQVVEVLDKGPYRERLNATDLSDGGLISRTNTVIKPTDYLKSELNDVPVLIGHRFAKNSEGMRVAGFVFDFSSATATRGLSVEYGCIIEQCVFRFSKLTTQGAHSGVDAAASESRRWKSPLVIRDCVFDGGMLYLSCQGAALSSGVMAVRNLFIGNGGRQAKGVAINHGFGTFVCRHNLFAGSSQSAITIVNHAADKRTSDYRFVNNTIIAGWEASAAAYGSALDGVSFENNIFVGRGFIGRRLGNQMEDALFEHWLVRNNGFTDVSADGDRKFTEQDASNRFGEIQFLSSDSNDPDFLRLPADSPAATAGAGGKFPQHAGALPPGPAPPEGDWFTRILDRWREAQSSHHSPSDESPQGNGGKNGMSGTDSTFDQRASSLGTETATLTEPPPLEEYLKGRKILTVKQDGTADFKTIQAALDALEPGQVVEVLDKGPYVENLEVASNQDGGLISRVQTQIAPTQWKEMEDGAKAAFLFKSSSNFRISGLSFDAPGPLSEKSQVVYISTKGSVTFEDCRLKQFGDHYSDKTPTIGALLVANDGAGIHVRGCNIIGSLQAATYSSDSLIVVEKNWIHGHASAGLSLQAGRRGQTRIAKNIISTTRPVAIFVAQSDATDANTLVVQDNTLISDVESIRVERHAHQALILEGNILNRPMTSHDADDKSRQLPNHWRIKDNIWPADTRHRLALDPPKSAVLTDVEFLSTKLTSRNYMRVRPDASMLGLGTFPKRFPGALPPGPAPPAGDWFTRLQDRWREAAEVSDDVAKTPGQATVRDLVLEALTLKAQPVRVGVDGGRGVDVSSPEQIPNYEYYIVGVRFFQTSTLTNDQVISWLKRVPQIQSLQFDHCANITDGVLSFVGETDFPVTELTLVNTKCTVEGLLRFLRNRAIRHLKVSGELFDPAVANAISRKQSLTDVLIINGDPKDWEQLRTLPNAAQLSKIGLSGATLPAEEWQQLQTFENAESLYFTSSNIADTDLSALQQLGKLQRLSLGNTKVTDVGLKTLSEIKTLRYLEIHHTKVTLEGLKELQRAIPQCEIIWNEGTLAPNAVKSFLHPPLGGSRGTSGED